MTHSDDALLGQRCTLQLKVPPEEAMKRLRTYIEACGDKAITSSFGERDFELRRKITSTLGWFSSQTTYVSGTVEARDGVATLHWRAPVRAGRVLVLLLQIALTAALLGTGLVMLSQYGWVWVIGSFLIALGLAILGWRAARKLSDPDPYLVSHLHAALNSMVVPEETGAAPTTDRVGRF
jgi:hypothetical protein